MLKALKNTLLIFTMVVGLIPAPAVAGDIWDYNKAPVTFSQHVAKSFLASLLGMGMGAAIARSSTNAKRTPLAYTWKTLVGGGIFFLGAYALGAGNTPEVWLEQFLNRFTFVLMHRALSFPDKTNEEWLRLVAPRIEAGRKTGRPWPWSSLEVLQSELKTLRVLIQKLSHVASILVGFGIKQFRPEAIVEVKNNQQQLVLFTRLADYRYAWVSTCLDYEEFNTLYARLSRASVLMPEQSDAWMRDAQGRLPYSALKKTLSDLSASFMSIDDISRRLMSQDRQDLLTEEQKAVFIRRYERMAQRKALCDQRLNYVSARADLETFNYCYQLSASASVLAERNPFNEESWCMRNGIQRNLNDVSRELSALGFDLQREIEKSRSLLQGAARQYFSQDELSDIAAKACVMKDLLNLSRDRQKMTSGLRKVDAFLTDYKSTLAPRVLQESSRGPSDLDWMVVGPAVQWPLEEVCQLLRKSRGELERVLALGQALLASSEVQLLSSARRQSVQKALDQLEKSISLVDHRLMFILNSTMYAEEVAKKRSLETHRKEQEARERREEMERREKERLGQLAANGTVPGDNGDNKEGSCASDVNSQASETLESCFCGDSIPANKMYSLKCPCKNSFYHRECIKRWVSSNKTCPTCRARVSLADIQECAVSLPAHAPASYPAEPVMPTAPPFEQEPVKATSSSSSSHGAQPPAPSAPVAPVEAEECYLCEDAVADSITANCDCTVKKPACRTCLDAWLRMHKTCPRCRKEGATRIAYKPAGA